MICILLSLILYVTQAFDDDVNEIHQDDPFLGKGE